MCRAMKCPQCQFEATHVGIFWICPKHGQLPESAPPVPLRIFLSYGHDANEELVRHIYADLKQRGHDVWFDKTEIKFGDEWRRAITDGILQSNRVLSFLSKHSTRDPGVCLDEIAIAIGAKGGNIQTILVESEQEVKPPPSISHLQWLDMHDWKERRAADESIWEQWYQTKLAEIIAVVESDESRRFAGEIKTLEELLKPTASDFTADSRIRQLLEKKLVGRTWLFEAVEKWRTSSITTPSPLEGEGRGEGYSRLFWLMGAPGIGKSAFAAHLAHEYGRGTVLAVHFCDWKKPDHRDACRIIRTLAFQIATRLPDYRKLLLTLPILTELDRKSSAELFDGLLTYPLKLSITGGRERYLIVIDALDEAGGDGRNELVDVLARYAGQLPDWIGLVVTSRPEFDVTTPFQALKPFPFETKSAANSEDIRAYLRHELAAQLQNRPDADRLVEQILEKSEGIFLYVEWFCRDLRAKWISLDDPERFPQGLGGMFFQFFQRQFPQQKKDTGVIGFTLSDYKERCRPFLELIVAAQEAPRLRFLCRVLKWSSYDQKEIIDAFGSLLNLTDGRIRMFHKSVMDWLCAPKDSGPYFVDINAGHRQLAEHCWQEFNSTTERVSWYARLYFQVHLDRIGEVQKKQVIEKKLRSSAETIRVYVSSTFRDMPTERELLVKVVFPQLRIICESRGVHFIDTDLRWGITTEEVSEGNVIELVLEEVRRCKPFFIGIIGERYGWVPERLPTRLIETQPWVRELPNVSVNELEIIQGVLSETQTLGYGLMYFRDPHFLEQLPAETRPHFEENQSSDSRAKLNRLKQRIRNAADEEVCLLRENYANPEELGRWILDDFTKLLNTFLPENKIVDPLTKTAREHDGFARNRARHYIIRQPYIDALNTHIASDGTPLMVSGNPGAGVSDLLSKWFLAYRETNPNDFVLAHFLGVTPDSAEVSAMLSRIMLELKRSLLLPGEVPNQPKDVLAVFPMWLSEAATRVRIVLLLDGLNLLHGDSCDLEWVPKIMPPSLHLIVSAKPGRSLNAARRRGWRELIVQPLTTAERKALIESVLAQYAKRLSPSQIVRIADAQQTSDVLFLQLMLDELRQYGQFEYLDERINHYLRAHNLEELYELIIARMEQDYGSEFVRTSLILIWASRCGLTEYELQYLLGSSDEPLPRAKFLPFSSAANVIFSERGGLLDFAHREAREAVYSRYLPTPSARQSVHHRLEVFFKAQQRTPRDFEELQWQQAQLSKYH